MRKIFLYCIAVFVILLPKNVKSQDSSTIQGLLQYIMQPLDKNQIGNGYLEEYGFPAISMATFNGTLSANNRFELNSWRLMYFQLFTGWCRATANPMTPIGTVNSTIKANTSPTLPTAIPILIGQYNTVKSNAFSTNLLSYNSSQRKVYDVPGRTQSPYESKRLFAAVPVNQYSTDGSESFIYRSNMVWGNTSLTISQLQINFGNGAGLQTLTANTAININYADTGAYVWTIRATLSDNSVVQCYSDYFVLAVSSGAQRFLPANITTPPVWGIIPAVAGVHSGATINIIYSSKQPPSVPNTTLRKPLIIVKNMDAFNIAPSLQISPYTVETFLSSINNEPQGYNFNQQLDDVAGYDLVFINFNDGMDGIVRNAAVVREAINRVNQNKQFDNRSNRREQNVVLGMGTGGLHARYALASMAKSTPVVNAETRLLITHDAPHRGANIALGLQHLIRMLGNFSYFGTTSADIFPDFAEAVAFFNAPINVETLLYRATSDDANTPNAFMNTTYRTMVDFAPGAQPWQFVPTSLGNECAAPLFAAGRQFINFNQGYATGNKMKLSIFGINIPVDIPLLELKYDCAVFASSIPASNVSNRGIAAVKTTFKTILFGLIQVFKEGYEKAAIAPTTYLAVDGVAGSFNTILDFKELYIYSSGIGNFRFSDDNLFLIVPISKFVKLKFYSFVKGYEYNSGVFTTQYTALPVGSALDVDPFNNGTFAQKFVNGSNPTYPSKGNTFIAQETNAAVGRYNNVSMRFTARNARFLFKEMAQQPNLENCSVECTNPFAIAGTDPVCASSTFFVQGLQRGVSVNWLISPSGFATLTVIDNQAIVNRVSNVDGVVTLTANIGIGCTSGSTVSRQVVIGRGVSHLFFNQCIVTCDAGPYLFANIAPVPRATACNWYYKDMSNSSNPFVFLEDAMFGTDWPLIRGNRNYTIRAEVITPCGNLIGDYVVFAPSCRGGFRVAASPNPVSDNLNISFFDVDAVTYSTKQQGQELRPSRSIQSTGKTIVTLFELTSGLQVKQWIYKEINSKGYRLSLAGVRKGLYQLQVDRDNNTTTTKIIVE